MVRWWQFGKREFNWGICMRVNRALFGYPTIVNCASYEVHMQSIETPVCLTQWTAGIIKWLISCRIPGQFWIIIGRYFMLAICVVIMMIWPDEKTFTWHLSSMARNEFQGMMKKQMVLLDRRDQCTSSQGRIILVPVSHVFYRYNGLEINLGQQ